MGGKDIEGALQLAGGILVGGLAMYRMANTNKEEGYETDESVKQQTQQEGPSAASLAAAAAIPEPVKPKKAEYLDQVAQHYQQSAQPVLVNHFQQASEKSMPITARLSPTAAAALPEHLNSAHREVCDAPVAPTAISSSTRTDEELPAWMSRKEPQVSPTETPQPVQIPVAPTPSSVYNEDELPEWMSRNQPQVSPAEAVSETSSLGTSLSTNSTRSNTPEASPTYSHLEARNAFRASQHITVEDTVEEELPSWMSRVQPMTPATEIAPLTPAVQSAVRARAPATPAYTPSVRHTTTSVGGSTHSVVSTARESVANVAHKYSDVVYVYPVTKNNYLGKEIVGSVDRNINNLKVQVKVMETRVGAGGAVIGSLSAGSNTSVLTSSRGLRLMLPNMYQIAAQRLPTVFHVAAYTVGEGLALGSGLDDLVAVRDTGFAMLASKSAQEAHDLAVVAHVAAQRSETPFVHFFDGVRTLNQVQKISTLSSDSLHLALGDDEKNHSPTRVAGLELAATEDCPHVATVVDQVMRDLEGVFGRRYKIFEYIGDANADSVVVTMSAPADVLEQTVREFGTTGGRVGVLVVRLLRPWSAAHFLQVLPKSVRRVCVLDQATNLRPLFQDVAASFHSNTVWVTPLVIGGRIATGPDALEFLPSDASAVFNNLVSANPQPNFIVADGGKSVHGIATDRHFVRPQGSSVTRQIVHYSSNASCTAENALASILGSKLGLYVQETTSSDALAGSTGMIRSDLRFGSEPINAAYSIVDSDVVVCDADVLHSNVDILAAAKDQSSLVITSAENEVAPDLNALPDALKETIARKQLRIVLVDSTAAESIAPGSGSWLGSFIGLMVADHQSFTSSGEYLKQTVRQAFAELGFSVTTKLAEVVHHLPKLVSHVDPRANAYSSRHMATPVAKFDDPLTRFVPRLAAVGEDESKEEEEGIVSVKDHEVAWNLIFKEAFESERALRPTEHGVYKVKLTSRKRLTPDDYDRNIFHLEFDTSGTDLTYQIGDALGVYGHNDATDVDNFLKMMEWDGEQFVKLPSRGHMQAHRREAVTLRNLLTKYLDIFGRPSKKFYIALAKHATSRYEYLRLMHIGTDDAESFKLGIHETVTFADLLAQYTSARPSVAEFIAMVPDIKPRHYSIASSMKLNPKSVHLLVVAVDWVTPLGKKRMGQCTRFLSTLDPNGEDPYVTVDIMPSVLRLPPSPKQPIVMAGLGTGMAPFRAFIQERKFQKESGIEVGPVVLYFGARHRSQEYLYGDELDEYYKEGLVTRLGLAFSRDQKDKVYIQHKIEADGELLKQYLGDQNGSFYLCGPTWPVPDVRDAIAKGMSPEKAKNGVVDIEVVEQLKSEGRYVLEVY